MSVRAFGVGSSRGNRFSSQILTDSQCFVVCILYTSMQTLRAYNISARLAPNGFKTALGAGGRWQWLLEHRQPTSIRLVTSAVQQNRDGERRKPEAAASSVMSPLIVVSFYKFADLPDYADMRKPLRDLCEAQRVSGGIILAPEGINGSICGTREALDNVFAAVQSDSRLSNLRQNEAPATPEDKAFHDGQTEESPLGAGKDAPFRWGHVRIKLKSEVVPLGISGIHPSKSVGTYVKPKDWNKFITDPETIVVDVRNSYEIRIGKFKGALDPLTESFREFPTWIDTVFGCTSSGPAETSQSESVESSSTKSMVAMSTGDRQNLSKPQRIAMYCTGGIRCEKASSFLLQKGFQEVYHLEGGVLNYLNQIPPTESLWEGECFVFDKRVSVEHGLKQGSYQLCYACKKPVNDNDMNSPFWEEGVSCPYCVSTKSDEEKERARARHRQYSMWGEIGGPDKGRREAAAVRKVSPKRGTS